VGLYGQPGHGKSFLAIDLALCVATGQPWQGHPVQRGYAIYVSAEGGTGIGKRVKAWLLHHAIQPAQARVAWLTESIPVSSTSEDMDVLLSRINNEIEERPVLIVIDTLARCFDGDENLQQDMGLFIGGIDRLRREYDATVLVVHHTRLAADRERGSTSFRGAADAMLAIERAGEILTLTNNKQKDAEEFPVHSLRLRVIPGADSCVIVGGKQERRQAVLDVFDANPEGTSYTQLIRAAEKRGHLSLKTVKRAIVDLLKTGEILKENGMYFKR
jgi:RecA-family ATPase